MLLLGSNLLLAPSCAPTGDDDDVGIDDDDIAEDDDVGVDDDDTSDPTMITAVTFAASTDGVPQEWAPGGAVTDLSGTFQFIYWDSLEDQSLHCRQRFAFTAVAQFGDAMPDAVECPACSGELAVTSVQRIDPSNHEDSCPELPADLDLSFLLMQDDIAVPSDFRTLSLLPAATLMEGDWDIGPSGLSPQEIVERYATAGLDVQHLAFVQPGGWLDVEARLDEVAFSWGDGGPLPMFVAYSPFDANAGDTMEGDCFLAGIWTVRVGAGLGADSLP